MATRPSSARHRVALHVASTVLAAVFASGCAMEGPADARAPAPAMPVSQQVDLQGRVASIDTSPWAYDGNGVLVLEGTSRGQVRVMLPARWNLCRATGLDALDGLSTGDRLRVVGAVSAPGEVTVCEAAEHRLERLP